MTHECLSTKFFLQSASSCGGVSFAVLLGNVVKILHYM